MKRWPSRGRFPVGHVIWLCTSHQSDFREHTHKRTHGVVRGIEIFSVPARGEEDVGPNTTCTRSLGELEGIERTSTRVGIGVITPEVGAEAAIGNGPPNGSVEVDSRRTTQERVSNDHTEALTSRNDQFLRAKEKVPRLHTLGKAVTFWLFEG